MIDFSSTDEQQTDNDDARKKQDSPPITRDRVEGTLRAGIRIEVTRNSKLRAEALTEHGTVCMMCGVDLRERYPEEYAERAIQVHHLVPLHQSGPVKTSLEDVWIVCSNCHDIIHAWIDDGGKPEKLREAGLFRPIAEEA